MDGFKELKSTSNAYRIDQRSLTQIWMQWLEAEEARDSIFWKMLKEWLVIWYNPNSKVHQMKDFILSAFKN